MLKVRGLTVHYGARCALRGIDLDLSPGEVLAVLGRNGAGRSSLARALMGLVPSVGQVSWCGQDLQPLAAHQRARRGLGYVPESRDAFAGLTVAQNLRLGLPPGQPASRIQAACDWFPALAPRLSAPATALSGGEQQMLSLARALLGQPRLLVVDEPTEGLSPQAIAAVARVLRAQREAGVAVLLIEQRLAVARDLADRFLLLGRGERVFHGTLAELDSQAELRREWLEL